MNASYADPLSSTLLETYRFYLTKPSPSAANCPANVVFLSCTDVTMTGVPSLTVTTAKSCSTESAHSESSWVSSVGNRGPE